MRQQRHTTAYIPSWQTSGNRAAPHGIPAASAYLTGIVNVNNTIAGDGTIGGAGLKLNNKAGGLIEANGSGSVLAINTGANTVVNAGTMAATVNSTLFIGSKVSNTGTLVASGGLIDCQAP